MGVEVTLFTLPEKCAVVDKTLNNRGNGQLLLRMNFLISEIRSGLPAELEIDSWKSDDYFSAADLVILEKTFESIQQNLHVLFNYLYDVSRGHDHLIYLLELFAESGEQNLPRAALLGSQPTPDSAKATQGRPIGWSNTEQTQQISKFLDKVDFDEMTCLLYTSPSPRDATLSRMPSSA